MRFLILAIAGVLSFAQVHAQDHDNRIKPGFKVGDSIPLSVPEVYLPEKEVREKLAAAHDGTLTQAVDESMELKWQQRVALYDADYILCFFDSTGRAEPGNNPRVLVLFTPRYEVKSWGRFTCEPRFSAGCIINRLQKTDTIFVTINQSSRFGGEISFEKYLIAATGIRKLGWDYELKKIPDEAH